MKKSLLFESVTLLSISLYTLACADGPTVPEPSAESALSPRAASVAKADDKGGPPARGYVTHPMTVTFADRAGDDVTSDGGGPYTDGIDGRWLLTDYADPSRPDHFQFLPGTERGSRAIRLTVPGVVPAVECGYFRFSVRDVDTPDLWSTGDGWSGTGSGTLQCEEGRAEYLLQIGECVAITRGAGQWSVVSDECETEIWSGSGRKAELLGTLPLSFAYGAIEL
ncbi:MAG TPA: hypothetical protein VLA09_04400 [Longimicrobiales bacterium]|nr:hypothetical protein [Longimicrobiales bacterium]